MFKLITTPRICFVMIEKKESERERERQTVRDREWRERDRERGRESTFPPTLTARQPRKVPTA